MNRSLVLFEDDGFVDLLPMVFWRSVPELQVGRKIVLDRTAQRLGLPVTGVWTRDWLARVTAQRCGAPANRHVEPGTVLANGRWLFEGPVEFPAAPCVGMIDEDVAYVVCDDKLAKELTPRDLLDTARREEALEGVPRREATGRMIRYLWDVVAELGRLLENDWREGDAIIESDVDARLCIERRERVHVGEGTTIHPTVLLDARDGPIYISYNVSVEAFAVLEGPLYLGPGCRVRPHAHLHGGNAIGPVCKVGGEVDGCVIHSYSNKQHAGFLGHAYVGSWVNIGAGATNSDLKNTYGKVRVPLNGKAVDTGQQFFGAIIGDHVKLGINATIPTGAVIGMASSIAATTPTPKYIPSFRWVTERGISAGDPLRLLDAATATMRRRDIDMTDDEVELFLDLGTRTSTFEAPAR